jgi:hypothetical protein
VHEHERHSVVAMRVLSPWKGLPDKAPPDHARASGHNLAASTCLTHANCNTPSIHHKDQQKLNNFNLPSQTLNSTPNPQSVSISRSSRLLCLPHLVVSSHPFVPPFAFPTGVQSHCNGLVHRQSIPFRHLLTHWQWARPTSSMTAVWKLLRQDSHSIIHCTSSRVAPALPAHLQTLQTLSTLPQSSFDEI